MDGWMGSCVMDWSDSVEICTLVVKEDLVELVVFFISGAEATWWLFMLCSLLVQHCLVAH